MKKKSTKAAATWCAGSIAVGLDADARQRFSAPVLRRTPGVAIARAGDATRRAGLSTSHWPRSANVLQAQIINLFLQLRDLNLTMLFINHDRVVRHVGDRVTIMYLERIIELGATENIFRTPRHLPHAARAARLA